MEDYMKKIINLLIMIALTLPVGSLNLAPSHGEEKPASKIEKKYEEKSFFDRMWIKIRKLSPNKYNKRSDTAVAGIKGAEKGSEELKPIWKGDESDRFLAEAAALKSAEDFMSRENFSEALVALGSFKKDYPKSPFMPNVLFMSAICHLSINEQDKAQTELQTLVSNYAEHELKGDAEELIRELGKKE